ncbi:probable cytochrome P450 303a1 [Cydia amplana]|uniref:probable cytochrome P450 303a1 n=1 Tax=Cydia amplana TaxID=1869771 RepID=UPI002FE6A75E
MWLTVLIVVLAICLFLYLDTVKPKNFPPGPKWIPIFGSALEIYRMRQRTGYLYKVFKQISEMYCKDSPLLGLKIGVDRIIMVNGLDAHKEMMFNEDCDGRPNTIFYTTRTWGLRRGVLLSDGELWKEQRKFLLKHLKEYGFGRKGMADIASFEAAHMVKDVRALIKSNKEGGVIHMHNFFNVYILNTLWSMLAGLRYEPTDPQMIVLQKLLSDLFSTIDMVGTVFSHFPILSVFAPSMSGYKNFVKTHERIWKFLREELERHKQDFDPEKPDKDFMDVYIRVLRSKEVPNTYSEGQLVAICMDMFMAGTETTSKSMSFGFSYMVRDVEVQRKAQEEIDRVVGTSRPPHLDDRPNMPFCEAIVYESVRHFMGRTFSVPHRTLRDTVLAGYNIPGDTMVVGNFTNILMDESLFPDPHSFHPDRFITNGKINVPEQYFPFGLSKHRCMGEVLAKCEIFVLTATLLQNYTFHPIEGEMPPLEHIDGATPAAAPYNARAVPRSHVVEKWCREE